MFEKTYVVAGENTEINWLQREYIPRPSTAKALEAKERLENVMNYYKLGESTRYRLLKGMVENIERKRKDEQEISLLPYRVKRIEDDIRSQLREYKSRLVAVEITLAVTATLLMVKAIHWWITGA
jgi:hypothetical protein